MPNTQNTMAKAVTKQHPLNASVIIPTLNRQAELTNCLSSIWQQTQLPVEVIIVDAAEDNALESYLVNTFPTPPTPFVYIQCQPSTTHQRNIAAQRAKGDIFIFLDDDVVLDKNFIAEIMRPFIEAPLPNIGGVTGRITNVSPLSWQSFLLSRIFGLSEPKDGAYKKSGLPTHRYLHADQKNVAPVASIPSGVAAYHRDVFQDYQFDETMQGYAYLEDCDLSLQVLPKHTLVYTPFAKLEHLETPTARGNPRVRARQRIRCYHYYFHKNWPNTVPSNLAYYWALVGWIIAALFSNKGSRRAKFQGTVEGIIDGFKGNTP